MNQQSFNQKPTSTEYPNGNSGYHQIQYIQEEKAINWKKYLFLFLINWHWFLISLGIALGIAFFKVRYTVPRFESTATLIIEEDEDTQDLMSEIRAIRYIRRRTDMANEVAKLGSFSMAKRTVDSIDQEIFWTAHGRIRERPLYKNPQLDLKIISDSVDWFKDQSWSIDIIDNTKFRLYKNGSIDTILGYNFVHDLLGWKFIMTQSPKDGGHEKYSFTVNNTNNLAKFYRNKLQINTDERDGTLITLTSLGPVGEREVDYLNAICANYIYSGLERKQQIAENTIHFIENQIVVIIDSLQQSEKQLITFRLSNNVINLSREGELAYEQLRRFIENKTQLKLQANYYRYLEKYVEDRYDPQTIISPTIAEVNDQLLVDAIKKLQLLYEERENLNFSVVNNNPGLESINTRIKSYRLRILEIINGLKDNNTLVLEQINIEEQAVINQLKSLPINEQQLLNIKRKYDLYNQFYTFLLQKRAEAGIQKASTISNARILDPARYDQFVPFGNNKRTAILFALLFGLFLPIIIFVIRDLLDNRIKESEDITNLTDIPIIGMIGHSEIGGALSVEENPSSPFTESLRRIRANLQFILRDPTQKVIMVTSSISGEGKTFTAANLAAILALNNKKVLLIGCDMRKPELHRIFNVENTAGLSSLIIGQNTVNECITKTPINRLFLLPSGPIPPNPAELIDTIEMQQLIHELTEEFDYVILDTPPIALVSDTLSLAKIADVTLYVVRQKYSHKDVISIANQMNNEKRLPRMNLVVNDIVPSRTIGQYYDYGFYRGYNYGYSRYYSKE